MKKNVYQDMVDGLTKHRDELKGNYDKLGTTIEEAQRARKPMEAELAKVNESLTALTVAAKTRASTETDA